MNFTNYLYLTLIYTLCCYKKRLKNEREHPRKFMKMHNILNWRVLSNQIDNL